MRAAHPLLCRALGADYAALGVTATDEPERFEWMAMDLPPAFFGAYEEMSAHDFVRRAVVQRPNLVLLDSDMISRQELESNPLHHRARDLGAPIEHVMSVMLHVGDDWSSGISFYRGERRPFSEDDRATLQSLAPALANAVRNCRSFELADQRSRLLEHLFDNPRRAAIALSPGGREIARTASATGLIERWFPSHERRAGQLPPALAERVRAWDPALEPDLAPLIIPGGDSLLIARLSRLMDGKRTLLVISMEEMLRSEAPPRSWQSALTPREREVCLRVVDGYSNRLIAEDLKCSEGTIKKHLQHIFDKLGVASRTQLIARIQVTRADSPPIATR